MSDLVGNPEDRFSHNEAQIKHYQKSLFLQNFYKDEINREEMYIRYVNKLFELHMVANNYTEAGLTLQLYAKLLNWSEQTLPKELRYPSQKESMRKDMLYQEIINCFDKGKVKAITCLCNILRG